VSKHRPPSDWPLETKLLIWTALFVAVIWILTQFTTAL